jgi:two-component system, NtrC family, sensor kinase
LFTREISQVFLNLIINAAHAIAAKGKKDTESEVITVETQFCSGWAEVRISDTGIGIPTEIQQHIFEPFFTTKEVGKGTGQGLTIAYDVVVYKHNGTITFNSAPGQGTVFIVRLPCVPSEQKPSNKGHSI